MEGFFQTGSNTVSFVTVKHNVRIRLIDKEGLKTLFNT